MVIGWRAKKIYPWGTTLPFDDGCVKINSKAIAIDVCSIVFCLEFHFVLVVQ
jgi:hypothetical protein